MKNSLSYKIKYYPTPVVKDVNAKNSYSELDENFICYAVQKCYLINHIKNDLKVRYENIVPSIGNPLTVELLSNPVYQTPDIFYDKQHKIGCKNSQVVVITEVAEFNSEEECQKFVNKENSKIIENRVKHLPVKIAIDYGSELKETIAKIQYLAHKANICEEEQEK